MPMKLTADVIAATKHSSHPMPVDLVHLSAQAMGDRTLELELLRLFAAQAPIYVNALRRASDQTARKHAAHALKGASRAVGAFALGDLAAQAELPGFGDLSALEKETQKVVGFIQSII